MCIGMANGGKTPQEKIEAIYPHIVVGGDIDKPCYNIHWYDIEQKTMICGFSSYKLELVRKWLEEEFEVVERDIDGLLKRQQEQLDNYSHNVRNMAKDFIDQQKIIQEQQAKIERLEYEIMKTKLEKHLLNETVEEIKAEAIKEFADRLNDRVFQRRFDTFYGNIEIMGAGSIDKLVKEMVGEGK